MQRGMQCAWALVLLFGLLAGCGPAEPRGDEGTRGQGSEADELSVIEAHDRWVRAYERGDVDALVDLLDDSGALLIFHPRLFDRFDDLEDVRQGLEAMFVRLGQPRWSEAHLEAQVRNDVAWLTSHVVIESSGLPEPFVGRGTEIWVHSRAGWRLIHAHWSTDPER